MNMKCIYCKSDITENNKSDEHVFPKSFGCPNTWTIDCVCRDCNVEFGKSVDRPLASDSIEGLWRLKTLGSKSKKHIRQTRVRINIPDEEIYGVYRGAIVYADFSKIDSLILPKQVLITDSQGERKFFLIDDVEKNEVKKELEGCKSRGFRILSQNAEEEKYAIEKLKEVGIEFKPLKEGRFPVGAKESDGKLKVVARAVIDNIIYRAIAKIAFNYLAKVKGGDFVLDPRFDTIRQYIKNGETPNFDIVEIERGHILANETKNRHYFEGHIFTVQTKGNEIIGKVSLSNTFNFYYVVKLGELGNIWYNLKSGHAYSLKEDKIIILFSPTFLSLRTKLAKIRKGFALERK